MKQKVGPALGWRLPKEHPGKERREPVKTPVFPSGADIAGGIYRVLDGYPLILDCPRWGTIRPQVPVLERAEVHPQHLLKGLIIQEEEGAQRQGA